MINKGQGAPLVSLIMTSISNGCFFKAAMFWEKCVKFVRVKAYKNSSDKVERHKNFELYALKIKYNNQYWMQTQRKVLEFKFAHYLEV